MPSVLSTAAVHAAPTVAAAPAKDHLYWIDWVRFLAALAVVVDHARSFNWDGFAQYTGREGSPALAVFISLFSLGRHAVVVFFVLSGWLVGGHAIERVRAGTFDAAGYAADRIARLYVPLLPTLLLMLGIVVALGGHPDPMGYVVCLFGLQGVAGVPAPRINAPLWTLAYETWFYVLAGCAAVACRRGGSPRGRWVGIAGTALALGVCSVLNGVYLACLLAGTGCGWLRGRLAPSLRPWTAVAGTLTMAAGAAIYQIDEGILPPPSADVVLPMPGVAHWIVAAGALLLLASVSSMAPRTGVGRRIERLGRVPAAFSYSLYLLHYPTLVALYTCLGSMPAEMTVPAITRWISWAAICVLVALTMYALFERRTPRVRRWLRARLGGGTTRAEAPPGRLPLAAEA